ncbi:MAG: NUDIX domain-containing protein [Rickettsiales bacterium]
MKPSHRKATGVDRNLDVGPPKFKKAGCIVVGWDTDDKGYRRLFMLGSYNEGRFAEKLKAPCIPKGSINPGEAADEAAHREAREETGIDIAKLERGEYEGVKVHQQTDIDSEYVSAKGNKRKGMRLKLIELEEGCIRKLAPHVKGANPDVSVENPRVRITAREMERKQGLPNLDTMITAFRTGMVPAVGEHAAAPCIAKPTLAAIEKKYCHQFRLDFPIRTADDWRSFNKMLRKADPATMKRLEADYASVKAYFERHKIVSDDGIMKMDDKITPGQFLQEAGVVLPAGTFLRHAASLACSNAKYAASAWADRDGGELDMGPAQLKSLIEVIGRIAPMEVADAAIIMQGQAGLVKGEAPQLNHYGMHAVRFAQSRHGADWQQRATPSPYSALNRTAR